MRDGFASLASAHRKLTAGSVNAVYDLLAQFDFHIVRSLRLKIDHNLLVNPAPSSPDVREVYSHGQAIAQCAGFIEGHGLHATKYPNTAMSAEMVPTRTHRRRRHRLAQLRRLYGLEVLKPTSRTRQQLHALCRHQPRAARLPRC
ncbi:MAG: prephenate dehydratase domain-containing protein [Collinsella sp.]